MSDLSELRPRLFGIAYRILGTIDDAEDIVQSAYVRYEEHRDTEFHNPGGWLAAVTARLAIDRVRALKRKREDYVGVWLPEPIVEDQQDPAAVTTLADDLAIGFLRVLERLGPEERTALLLHDVFNYSHSEISVILYRSEEAVRQMVSRARRRVHEERPRLTIDSRKASALVERFVRAVHDANLEELQMVLATDVVVVADGGGKVNARPGPIAGVENVVPLLVGPHGLWNRMRLQHLAVNGLPGAALLRNQKLVAVVSLDFSASQIRAIDVVLNPDKLSRVNIRN